MTSNNLSDLGIEGDDIYLLGRVLGLNVGRNRQVVVILGDLAIIYQRGVIVDGFAGNIRGQDLFPILLAKHILVP